MEKCKAVFKPVGVPRNEWGPVDGVWLLEEVTSEVVIQLARAVGHKCLLQES